MDENKFQFNFDYLIDVVNRVLDSIIYIIEYVLKARKLKRGFKYMYHPLRMRLSNGVKKILTINSFIK